MQRSSLLFSLLARWEERADSVRSSLLSLMIETDDSLIRYLSGHTRWVHTVQWAHSDLIVSSSFDATCRLWRPSLRQQVAVFNHPLRVRAALLARNASILASASGQDVCIWNCAVPESEVYKIRALKCGEIQTLCWMDDEGLSIAAAGTKDRPIRMFDVRAGEATQNLEGHTGDINSLALKNSTMLVSGSKDGMIRFWDLRRTSQDPVQVVDCKNRGVRVCRFVNDEIIGVGGYDSCWRQYSITTGLQIGYTLQHDGWIFDADIDSRHGLLATGASNPDYRLRLWDSESGRLLSDLGSNLEHGASASFCPDLPFLVSGTEGNRLAIHDLKRFTSS